MVVSRSSRAIQLAGDRADHVVGLEARHLVDGDAQGLDDLADLGELVTQVVGHLDPGRLVVGVLLVAERRTRQVERDREVVRLEVLDAAQHDAREAEHAVDQLALRGRQGRQGEVSAVDEPVAVEQHQAFGGHGCSVREGRVGERRRHGRRVSPGGHSSAGRTAPRPTISSAPATTNRRGHAGGVIADGREAGRSSVVSVGTSSRAPGASVGDVRVIAAREHAIAFRRRGLRAFAELQGLRGGRGGRCGQRWRRRSGRGSGRCRCSRGRAGCFTRDGLLRRRHRRCRRWAGRRERWPRAARPGRAWSGRPRAAG